MVVMVGSKTAITMVEVMKKAVMLVGLFSFHPLDRKSTRLNSSHGYISYAVFCLKKKKKNSEEEDRRIEFRHVADAVRRELSGLERDRIVTCAILQIREA